MVIEIQGVNPPGGNSLMGKSSFKQGYSPQNVFASAVCYSLQDFAVIIQLSFYKVSPPELRILLEDLNQDIEHAAIIVF